MAGKLKVRDAQAQADAERGWTCQTCDTMTEGDGPYCRSCASYWADVADGLWDRYDDGRKALEAGRGG